MVIQEERTIRNEDGKDAISRIHSVLSNSLIICLLGIFPLVYHNNYIDIQTCKAWTFRVIAVCYLLAEAGILVFSYRCKKKNHCDRPGKVSYYDSFLILFVAGITLSSVFSKWPIYSLNGNMGRNVGTVDLFLVSCLYLALIRHFRIRKFVLYIVSALNGLEFLLIILNFWGLDPLKMYENLIKKQHNVFIGTVGNINVACGFLCIVLPADMALFVICRNKYRKAVYGLLILFGTYAGFATSCDSFLLGCAAAFGSLVLYVICTESGMMELSVCLFLFFLAALAMRLSLRFAHYYKVHSRFIRYYEKDSFLASFINSPFLAVVLGCAIILSVLSILSKSRFQVRVLKILFCFAIAMLCAGILLVLIANLFSGMRQTQRFSWLNQLVIDDEFGSGRGYIWKRSLEMWMSYPFSEKMIGCGTDCFFLQMVPVYGQEMMDLFEEVFADAHCEFLQLLVTTGLIGVAGYFGFWSGILIAVWRKMKEIPALLICLASICAYMVQGFLNNLVPACVPLIFVFAAISKNISLSSES